MSREFARAVRWRRLLVPVCLLFGHRLWLLPRGAECCGRCLTMWMP